jgi:hypothetical protein
MPKCKVIELEEATASEKKKPCQRYKHEYTELWNWNWPQFLFRESHIENP